MATSRQAYELDHARVRLEAKICDMEKESSHRLGERMKLESEVEELKNLAKELGMDIVEKDTRLTICRSKMKSSDRPRVKPKTK